MSTARQWDAISCQPPLDGVTVFSMTVKTAIWFIWSESKHSPLQYKMPHAGLHEDAAAFIHSSRELSNLSLSKLMHQHRNFLVIKTHPIPNPSLWNFAMHLYPLQYICSSNYTYYSLWLPWTCNGLTFLRPEFHH